MVKTCLYQICILVCVSSVVQANDFKRFEFQPYAGFTASGGIPLKAEDGVSAESVEVNSSYSFGMTFSLYFNELDAVEGSWQRQFSEGRLPADIGGGHTPGGMTPFSLNIDQIHCNFLHHYKIANPDVSPYVMAGLGATTYYGSGNGISDSKSYFSFAIGGGVKFYFSRYLGFRGEARWSPTVLSASDSGFWCSIGGAGANCLINLKASLQHQLDLTAGIVLRF
jgi:hypothetical protein